MLRNVLSDFMNIKENILRNQNPKNGTDIFQRRDTSGTQWNQLLNIY